MRNGHYCSMDLLVSSLTRQTNLFSGVDISYCTGKYFSLSPRCEVITGMGNFRINPMFLLINKKNVSTFWTEVLDFRIDY